ncbi:MAG: hypothetical protein N3D71_00825 [Burkholderiaceae bacterium]|nr:hypothetical protein [Burkholderiaceae bacterium]
MSAPGRSCPPHYGYSPRVFARPPEIAAETLYVIGGLYGNPYALDAIDALAATEAVAPVRVFNGDFHWFDAEPALFAEVQRRVLAHIALRGNVETELAADDDAAGCGCAYPESVPDDDVERSNAILARLRGIAQAADGDRCSRQRLGALPMHAVAQVGEARIAIVHGDAWGLAGWRFAHDSLHDDARSAQLAGALELGAVDGYACSHTCAPALKAFERGFVINNGAAGMANFAGTTYGVLTRISTRGLPRALQRLRLYGLFDAGCFVDALKIEFDLAAWLARFDAIWPAGSPAAISYRRRIVEGPAFTIDHALGRMPAATCHPAAA